MHRFFPKLPSESTFGSKSLFAIWITTFFAFVYSLYFVISTSTQSLLDLHSFRQSQTALGAFWLKDSSSWLQYQVPVIGYPWSIPFEFPTYQILVHYFAIIFGLPLVQTGRLLSYLFLLLLIFPLQMLIKDLKLPKAVLPLVLLFLLTSSDYLYWSRTFMIETTALFFTIFAIAISVRYVNKPKISTFVLTLFLGILAGLTKSTTALSFLFFLSSLITYFLILKRKELRKRISAIVGVSSILFLTTLVALRWIQYSDSVKSLNLNARALTSTALKGWNYGTLDQRFSTKFWFDLILQRTLLGNLGAGIGLIIIIIFLVTKSEPRLKAIVAFLLIMFLIPLFVFTNLHLVHWYYQVSCQVYLFLALAIIFGYWIDRSKKNSQIIAVVSAILVAAINLSVFGVKFLGYAEKDYSVKNSQILSVADFVKNHTASDDVILIYGQDWSSALAFAAERKSATLPSWMPGYLESYTNPKSLFNGKSPAAIVDCLVHIDDSIHPTLEEIKLVSQKGDLNSQVKIKDCQIWYRS